MDYLFVATDFDVLTYVREREGWRRERRSLAGKKVTRVTAGEKTLLAGTTEGIFRSADLGQSWWPANEGLTTRHIRALAYHPQDAHVVLAGTQPAEIFVSRDGSQSWQPCQGVTNLRDKFNWSMPYAPDAGCVRDFAFQNERVYAGVEQGGLLYSNNRGEIWHLAEGSNGKPNTEPSEGEVQSDVHGVVTHASPQQTMVFAATGGGLFRSMDAGESWSKLHDGYCRDLWVDPNQAEWIIFGPAGGVDRNGRVEMSTNGGDSWEDASEGLDAPWEDHMVERFAAFDDKLLAVLSNGKLYLTEIDQQLDWQRILPDAESVNDVVFVRVP